MICSIFTRDQPLHWVFSHVGWTSSSNSQCVCNHIFSGFYFNHLCNILYNFQFFCIIHNQFSCISSHQHHQKTLPPGLFYQEGLPSLKNTWWYFTLNLRRILKTTVVSPDPSSQLKSTEFLSCASLKQLHSMKLYCSFIWVLCSILGGILTNVEVPW